MTVKRILLVAAAVFLGILYFSVRRKQELSAYLFPMQKDETITSVSLENQYGTLEFRNDGGTWTVEKDRAYSVNEEKMKLILSALSSFKVSRKLKQDNGQYGLDPFQAKVSFTTSRGKEHALTIGNATMTGTDRYAESLDTGEVIVTDAASSSQMFGSLDAYRRKEILTVQADRIATMEYRKGDQLITALAQGTGNTWNMTYPFKAPARKIEIGEFISAMKDWNVAGYEYKATDQELGLDKNGYNLTIRDTSGKEQVLWFGKDDGKKVAVRNGGQYDVLYLYSDEVNLKGLEPGKLLFVAPFAESTDRIKSIDLTFGDSTISFSVDGKAGTVSCNGTFVDMEQYTKFYISMMALTATGGEKESFTPQGTPDISIRTVDLDGAVTEVVFTGRDEQTYNMTINGVTQYYTDRSRLTRMMEKLKDCLKGQSSGS